MYAVIFEDRVVYRSESAAEAGGFLEGLGDGELVEVLSSRGSGGRSTEAKRAETSSKV